MTVTASSSCSCVTLRSLLARLLNAPDHNGGRDRAYSCQLQLKQHLGPFLMKSDSNLVRDKDIWLRLSTSTSLCFLNGERHFSAGTGFTLLIKMMVMMLMMMFKIIMIIILLMMIMMMMMILMMMMMKVMVIIIIIIIIII